MDRKYLGLMMEAGYIYIGQKRFDEAREIFEGLCTLAPDSDVPIVALGNVSFCQGKVKEAIKHYEQALKIDPKSLFAKAYLAEALFFSGKKEQALERLIEVRDQDKNGAAGNFAKALLDAIHSGFTPQANANRKESSHAKTSVH